MFDTLEPFTTNSRAVGDRVATIGYWLVRSVTIVGTVTILLGLLLPASTGPYGSGFAVSYLVGNLNARRVFLSYGTGMCFYTAFDRVVKTKQIISAGVLALVAVVLLGDVSLSLRSRPLQLLPFVDGPIPFYFQFPSTTVLTAGIAVWAVGSIVRDGVAATTGVDDSRATDKESLSAQLERRRWYVVSLIAGYTVVVACLVSGVTPVLPVPFVPRIWSEVAPVLLLFGFAAYGFVSTDSLYGTAGLAAGAWATGLAALQYDGALPGVALPAAVLLTLAAVGLWLDGR